MTRARILVTGAGGFIGRHSLPLLTGAGHEVHAVGRRVPPRTAPGVHWHEVDLLDAPQTSALVARVRPSHLLHLAWYVAPGDYRTSAENLRWVGASLDLLRGFADAGGRRVVAAGTCFEYDWGHDGGRCSETLTPLLPSTLYGACKHSAQVASSAFARERGLSAAWARIFFLFGPHQARTRFVPSVVNSLLRGEEALCSHGRQIRDFMYVKDVAAALVALLQSDVTGPVNLASGTPRTLGEIARAAGEALGRPELIRLGAIPAPAGEPAVLTADVTKLRKDVAWSPGYDLARALSETIDWWQGRSSDDQSVGSES